MELKIFTLNCWGLFGISKDRELRINAIADMLAASQYDVVCLQEVWLDCDFDVIKNKAASVLPYAHYFYSGVVGSGICILSRHPIEETFYHQWPVNGYIHKLQHGDWFGGKGVALCKLRVHNKCVVHVYSTHLHAEYNRNSDEYQAHRIIQAFDTAQFVQMTSQSADLVVLAGDLNTEPGDLAYRVFTAYPNLMDAFVVHKTRTSFNGADVSAHLKSTTSTNCSRGGWVEFSAHDIVPAGTNDVPSNRYTPSHLKSRSSAVATNCGTRIDYILYHPGNRVAIDLKEYSLPLPSRIPCTDCSYSDHEAVAATLVLTQRSCEHAQSNGGGADVLRKRTVLEESIAVCDHALKLIQQQRLLYIIFTIVFTLLLGATFICSFTVFSGVLFKVFIACSALCLGFSLIMATIWHKIERHAILAGKLAMTVSLNHVLQRN